MKLPKPVSKKSKCFSRLKITLYGLAIAAFNCSCYSLSDDQNPAAGKQLAAQYCGNCHLVPDPALLDKITWRESVLPAMAGQLGIEVLEGNMYLHSKQSAISSPDWQRLLQYYETLAPETLPISQLPVPKPLPNPLFLVRKPAGTSDRASTMVVKFDTAARKLVIGPSAEPALFSYNQQLQHKLMRQLASPPVHIGITPGRTENYIITAMGGMRALDHTIGQISHIAAGNMIPISKDLIRPIETTPVDYNQDDLTDYVVCAFGHNVGGLYVLKQTADLTYQKVVVKELPGATHTTIRDFNQDGWPDIMALFAHGDEGIWVFINDQKGGFKERNILRFPSVYGSSSFQLADMNGDGREDIVYTAGDNSDYSRILKPYHGIYIFTNTAGLTFKQTFFYPINGCTKAIAADFDQDGKMEIATIAFFADLKNKPFEKFLYFKGDQSRMKFTPYTLPVDSLGRWICMDAADWDGDGDTDIVLGNYSRGFLNQEDIVTNWNVNLPFIVLENRSSN